MNRTLNVVRMQLVNRQTYIWVPLIVLGGSFVIALAIYGMIEAAGVSAPKYGGGAQAPLWYFGVVGIQALTLTFPFSQAMSVTRRDFYVGTLLSAVMTSAILSVVFVIGGFIEELTGGWWINGYFFLFPWIWDAGPFVSGLVYFTVAMLFFAFGFWAATLYKRFGTAVLTSVLVALGLALTGLAWLITRAEAWVDVATWFVEQGPLGLSLWGLVVIAVLAVISYGTLRRAVP